MPFQINIATSLFNSKKVCKNGIGRLLSVLQELSHYGCPLCEQYNCKAMARLEPKEANQKEDATNKKCATAQCKPLLTQHDDQNR